MSPRRRGHLPPIRRLVPLAFSAHWLAPAAYCSLSHFRPPARKCHQISRMSDFSKMSHLSHPKKCDISRHSRHLGHPVLRATQKCLFRVVPFLRSCPVSAFPKVTFERPTRPARYSLGHFDPVNVPRKARLHSFSLATPAASARNAARRSRKNPPTKAPGPRDSQVRGFFVSSPVHRGCEQPAGGLPPDGVPHVPLKLLLHELVPVLLHDLCRVR
jgi:hypothetical protein